MEDKILGEFVKRIIKEDLGDGDHTSRACIPSHASGKAKLLIKAAGILAGIRIAKKIFNTIDRKLIVDILIEDGEKVKPGDIGFLIKGNQRSILQAERLVLNILQRMSGIATNTNQYVTLISGTRAKILDTRKTTPGIRFIEKEAVRIGGGINHRMGLYDMIMIKDNHILYAGSIEGAINRAREYLYKTGKKLKIEIEAGDLNEVKSIISTGGIDRIMLDNFNIEDTRAAVKMIDGRYEIESSGGINLETVKSYADCGVDFISVGALTHQYNSLDMSLEAFD